MSQPDPQSGGVAGAAGDVASTAVNSAQETANAAIDAAEKVAEQAVHMSVSTLREVAQKFVDAQQALLDAAFGKQPGDA